MFRIDKKDFIGAVLASAVSFFAYQTGVFFFLFMIPLQLLVFKSGIRVAKLAMLGVGVALVYLGIKNTAGVTEPELKKVLLLMEFAVPCLLMGGFLMMNNTSGGRANVLRNIFVATVFTAGFSVLLFHLIGNEAVENHFRANFSVMLSSLKSAMETSGSYELVPLMNMDADAMLEMVSTIFFRGFLFAYFCILFVTYSFALSIEKLTRHECSIITVAVPDYFVWVLAGALGTVLLDSRVSVGVAGYVGWNVFLIIMFLYGLRGLGIIRQIFETRRVPPFLRFILIFIFVSMIMSPMGKILLVAIPCIGIAEVWFKYKRT